MLPKKVTIHHVADYANVSVTTVSLVLSGKGRISTATIERVQQAIHILGYVPNRQAAVLRGANSGIIALILHDSTDPFYADVISGISNTLAQHSRFLLLMECHNHKEQLYQCFDILCQQSIDGIILACQSDAALLLKARIEQQQLPYVYIATARNLEELDLVRPDNHLMAQLATNLLIQQGHRNIAYLGGNSSSLVRAERLGGMLATLIQHQLPFNHEWIIECNSTPDAANKTESLLHQYPNISAIICDDENCGLGAYFSLLRTGKRLAKNNLEKYYDQQIALICLSNHQTNPPIELAFDRVIVSAKEMGCQATIRLLQRLSEHNLPIQQIVLPPHIKSESKN